MIDLSIVIVSWNTSALLRECLETVYKYTSGIAYEIFVVDNNSSDDSAEMVRHYFPEVHFIGNRENTGFSRANNQAIRMSSGRYIALLNPDTVLIEDVFTPLINYADQFEKIGAIGPKILRRDGRTIQYSCARKLPTLYFDFCRLAGISKKFSKTRLFGGEYLSHWDHNSSRNVEGLVGACMVVRKKTIDQVGLMDENQFMYGDEIDWCKRMLDDGWIIRYFAGASIIHYGGESSRQVKVTTSIEAEKAKMYFYSKHYGRLYAGAFCLQVCMFNFSKYMWSVLANRKNSRWKELQTIYKSTFAWSLREIINREAGR